MPNSQDQQSVQTAVQIAAAVGRRVKAIECDTLPPLLPA